MQREIKEWVSENCPGTMCPGGSADRLQAQKSSVSGIGQEIQKAVGPLPHVPNPADLPLQQHLLVHDLPSPEDQAAQVLTGQRADEDIPPPGIEGLPTPK